MALHRIYSSSEKQWWTHLGIITSNHFTVWHLMAYTIGWFVRVDRHVQNVPSTSTWRRLFSRHHNLGFMLFPGRTSWSTFVVFVLCFRFRLFRFLLTLPSPFNKLQKMHINVMLNILQNKLTLSSCTLAYFC